MAGGPSKTKWYESTLALIIALGTILSYVVGLTAKAVVLQGDVETLKVKEVKASSEMDTVKSAVNDLKTTAEVVKTDVKWLVNNMKNKDAR